MILPLSLTFAAAAALINLWLAFRIGKIRISDKVLHGDGGNTLLMRRMRAQANFIEYTPIILILFALVELSSGSHWWLWAIMGFYLIARVSHAIGMDADNGPKTRQFGIAITFLTSLILAGAGLWAAYGGKNVSATMGSAQTAVISIQR